MHSDAIARRPTSLPRYYRRALASLLPCLVVLFLTACNTTPEKPPPAPEPLPEAAPPLTPPPLPDSAKAPPLIEGEVEEAAGGGGSGAPGTAGNFPPPRSDAAEVEMEEVPVGENGQPAPRPRTEVLAEIHDSQAGGGGAAMPAGGRRGDGTAEAPTTGQAMVPGSMANAHMAAPAVQVGGTAQTVAEQRATLDGELAAKLDTFDAQMRRTAAGAEGTTAAGGGSDQGAVGGQGQRNDRQATGAGGAAASGSGLGNTPDLVGTRSGPVQPSPLLAGTPSDVGDGADDDVLARQLREAAQKEKDPVLRDKLWTEYRKYKAGR